MNTLALLLFLAGGLNAAGLVSDGDAQQPEPRWWKGNTHTHTLWSDGDGAPELVVDWYARHDYHFLVLSDHNILSQGEKWFPIIEHPRSRLTEERVEELRERFGPDWVEERDNDGQPEMRLRNLPELKEKFESSGRFILIQGEEITDHFARRPVHVNAMNIEEYIPPQGGDSIREVMQRNIDAVIEQGKRLDIPVLAHVNHPNFGWALTAEDLAHIRGERFFEVYNGHPSVHNYGDEERPGTEEMWDIAVTLRLTELDLGLLYGLATDDSHHYHQTSSSLANAGRGWVMVRCRDLTAADIIEALNQGEFYSSSGVSVEDFGRAGGTYFVNIVEEEGVEYVTQFIGTRRGDGDATGPVGEVLHETTANPAVYRFRGDELYVRAKVISTRPHPNPYREGDMETAWLQPVQRAR